jgi:hypothetical protein
VVAAPLTDAETVCGSAALGSCARASAKKMLAYWSRKDMLESGENVGATAEADQSQEAAAAERCGLRNSKRQRRKEEANATR